MIESSNTQEAVEPTVTAPEAPVVDTPAVETKPDITPTPDAPAADLSMREAMEKKAKDAADKVGAKPPDAPVVPGTPAPGTPAAYQANYKYKAFGKEKELPEAFRSLIKDDKSEKEVKEVFTRADAFDDMKSQRENIQKEFQSVLGTHQALDKDVRRVMNFKNTGDFDNFFASLKISDKEVFDWAQAKLAAMKDPAQLQQYQSAAQQRASLLDQQESYTNLQQSYSNQAVQARTMQLDMTLGRPDVSSMASAWDSKVGQIGAFRNLVIQEAANAYFMSGQKTDMSVEEAVDSVMKKFGKFVEASPQAIPSAVPLAPGAPAAPQAPPVIPAAKPVIPNIQGKGASPVKKVPKSLDELRARGKELRKIEEIPNY